MYRIVFFKIPFMRGGYRVPACVPLMKPIIQMGKFRVAEVVTDLAFSETQREIIVDGETAAAADDGMANYVYIAQTTNSTIGTYMDDVRGAYYWVDDLQFVGVQDGSDAPAAVVTISPDVWLTDYMSGSPTIRGRLVQTSNSYYRNEPKTPLVKPIFDAGGISQFSPFDIYPDNIFFVGVFAQNDGSIALYGTEMVDSGSAATIAQRFGGAANITRTGIAEKTWQVSCVKLYALPYEFIKVIGTEKTVIDYGSLVYAYTLKTAEGDTQTIYPVNAALGSGEGLERVFDVKISDSEFTNINSRRYIATPAKFVELSEINGISVSPQDPITVASFYIAAAPFGDDTVSVYMQISGEFYDVTNDFIVDFAANTAAIQQAQQKQLVALQAITGVIGAAGGVAGGIASGNYFGAVQAAAGGVEAIASIGAARRTPAQITASGGALSFLYAVGSLVIIISMGEPRNKTEMENIESEFGWLLDNAPYFVGATQLPMDAYYRFSEVTVDGITGGQGAAQEVANALVAGVRIVDISKL